MAKQKYYVVWEGVTPGIYSSWTDCQLQTKGYEGAKYLVVPLPTRLFSNGTMT